MTARRGERAFGVLLAAVMLAGALGAITPGAASASACVSCWTGSALPNPSPTYNALYGVAALSSSNAWTVGHYRNGTTLIEHWNGMSWRRQLSPDPGGSTSSNYLNAVAATSSSNAWAVGDYYNGTATKALALHCC